MMPTMRVSAVGVVALTIGAGACRNAEPAAEASAITRRAGTLTVAADSPMLKQIRREQVGEAEVATDEVIAPGKIEANPNRGSKIVVPLPGRIARVLPWVGTGVRQG